ncbi:MAG: MSMEG_1061 family FMN-dependent PPOX-type flavoprotein [Pseudomonadota bacterium]
MRITDETALRDLYDVPLERSVAKELTTLDDHCRAFIAASPFVILTTSGPQGLDVTPRGDAPGFIEVEDGTHLLLPDRPGNNRLDALTNILGDPRVGLLFLIPGVRETLRIRGRAEIRVDPEVLERCEARGHPPISVLRIAIDCAFIHCAKSVLRSGLWSPETWSQDRPVATMSEMMRDHAARDGPLEPEDDMIARYKSVLY